MIVQVLSVKSENHEKLVVKEDNVSLAYFVTISFVESL